MSSAEVFDIAFISLRVSALATLAITPPAVVCGYLLARGRFPGRALLRTVLSLPMVLPPVAVGLVLLRLFARGTTGGRLAEFLLGHPLLLSWEGAVVVAAVMSFPLLLLGAERGFDGVPRRLEAVAASLGASPWSVFRTVSLPLAARGIGYGVVFAFARGLGEFGATALVAGRIPGRTETLSLGIYGRIEDFREGDALVLSLVALVLALAITGAAELLLAERRR